MREIQLKIELIFLEIAWNFKKIEWISLCHFHTPSSPPNFFHWHFYKHIVEPPTENVTSFHWHTVRIFRGPGSDPRMVRFHSFIVKWLPNSLVTNMYYIRRITFLQFFFAWLSNFRWVFVCSSFLSIFKIKKRKKREYQ